MNWVSSNYQLKHFHKYRIKMVSGQAWSTHPVTPSDMDRKGFEHLWCKQPHLIWECRLHTQHRETGNARVSNPFPVCSFSWDGRHDRNPAALLAGNWVPTASFHCTFLPSSVAQNLPHHMQPWVGFHRAQWQLYTGHFNYLINDKFILKAVLGFLA